jgi:parallel beta-helix repeat protein
VKAVYWCFCVLAAFCLVVAHPGTAFAAGSRSVAPQQQSQSPIKDNSYLDQVVSALPSGQSTLVISVPMTLRASLILSPDIAVRFVGKGSVNTAPGVELRIQGVFTAPAQTIFFGSGAVRFSGNDSSPVLLPEWWGAIGNGVHDDGKAVQEALSAAQGTAGGASVQLTKPRYLSTQALTIGSNVRLIGNGPRSGLFFENHTGLPSAVRIVKAGAVEISNLSIEGSSAVPTVGRLIELDGAINVHISHCVLSGANLKPRSGQISAIAFENSNDVWVEDNDISNDGPINSSYFGVEIGGYLQGGSRIHVRRNHVRGARTLYAVHLTDTSNSDVLENVIDQGNKDAADNHSGYGITLYSLNSPNDVSNEVSGNTVTNCAGQGIYLVGVDHSKITGNTVVNVASKQADNVLAVGGISLNETNDVEISNNVIKTSGKAGVVLANTRATKIQSNRIEDTKEAAIWFRHNEQQAEIRENTIAKSEEAGVRVTMASSRLQMTSNQISQTGAWAVIFMSSLTDGAIADNKISAVSAGGGIYIGGGSGNSLHHNDIRDVRGSAIDYRGEAATIDDNYISGVDRAATIHGIVISGSGNYIIERNNISNCLEGINLSDGRGSVKGNILRSNTRPFILGKRVSATENVLDAIPE